MGPSPSEGADLERRNSQESTNYRRPAEQQHQPSHHIQPSNPGMAGGCGGQQLTLLCMSPSSQLQLMGPSFPPPQSTSSSSRRRLSPMATRSRWHQPPRSATLLREWG